MPLRMVSTLVTLNILSEIAGVGDHFQVKQPAIVVGFESTKCRVPDLDIPIAANKAMNSPNDRQAAMELEAIWNACAVPIRNEIT